MTAPDLDLVLAAHAVAERPPDDGRRCWLCLEEPGSPHAVVGPTGLHHDPACPARRQR